MTIKHGSHTFNLDPSTTDTFRHFHEGEADAVAMISPDRFALVLRWGAELTPEVVAARYMHEADLVLCEGFKQSSMAKIEVFRIAAHPRSLMETGEIDPARVVAMVTDAREYRAPCPVFQLGDAQWLSALADFVQQWWEGERRPAATGTLATEPP